MLRDTARCFRSPNFIGEQNTNMVISSVSPQEVAPDLLQSLRQAVTHGYSKTAPVPDEQPRLILSRNQLSNAQHRRVQSNSVRSDPGFTVRPRFPAPRRVEGCPVRSLVSDQRGRPSEMGTRIQKQARMTGRRGNYGPRPKSIVCWTCVQGMGVPRSATRAWFSSNRGVSAIRRLSVVEKAIARLLQGMRGRWTTVFNNQRRNRLYGGESVTLSLASQTALDADFSRGNLVASAPGFWKRP